MALLEAIGFTASDARSGPSISRNIDGDALHMSPDWPLKSLQRARSLLADTLKSSLCVEDVPPMPTVPEVATTQDAIDLFNPYQHQHMDGLSKAVGTRLLAPDGWKSQTEQQVEALKQKQEAIQRTLAANTIPRQWNAWREPTGGSSSLATASDTSLSSTSQSDASLIASHAKKQMLEAQSKEKQGFTTKAMRDLQKLQKQKVYSETVLKIHFPDGSGISGHFAPSQTTIEDVVQALLHEVLVEQVFQSSGKPSSSFIQLFTTPPRTILDPKSTLEGLQLVPAAKVHVQWKAPLVANNRGKGWFIRDDWFTSMRNQNSAVPRGVALVGNPEDETPATAQGDTGSSTTAGLSKQKKNKVDKEAALLKRMMGK